MRVWRLMLLVQKFSRVHKQQCVCGDCKLLVHVLVPVLVFVLMLVPVPVFVHVLVFLIVLVLVLVLVQCVCGGWTPN